MPRTSATVSRTQNGAWQGVERTSPSPSGSGTATEPLGSRGAAASRWLTNRARTTTSAPSRARDGSGQRRSLARLPAANSREASVSRAARGSVSTGRGS
jgi:hypothetical protein